MKRLFMQLKCASSFLHVAKIVILVKFCGNYLHEFLTMRNSLEVVRFPTGCMN